MSVNPITRSITLTVNNQTSFTALDNVNPNILSIRISEGYSEITGIVTATAIPGGGSITLNIEQSFDGVNWDQVDAQGPLVLNTPVSFAYKVIAPFARVNVLAPGAAPTGEVRLGGLLKVASDP